MDDKIIICRCEDITLGEIRNMLKQGIVTPEEIKRLTRCGMGPCQGRTCRPHLLGEIARELGVKVEELSAPSFRQPTEPIIMEAILRGNKNAQDS